MEHPTGAPGDLAFQILLAIGEGPAHGYAIGKEVAERSGGRLRPTTGALYQALKRLRAAGLIESVEPAAVAGDGRRKYFALTDAGRAVVAEEAKRLESLVAAARQKKLYPASA